MDQNLIGIALQWITTGELSSDNGTLLKAQYLEDIGAPKGCKTCGSVWSDIKHHFSYKLKLLNLLPVANKQRKYLILGAGFLMLPGSSTVIVNDGQESEDRQRLTDAMAEQILSEFPSYSSLIGINPAWAAANGESEDGDELKAESTEDATELSALQEKLDALQAQYDSLVKEHEQTKSELSVTKGQLTKANNKLAKAETAAPATTPTTPAEPLGPTDAAVTGQTGTPGSESSPAGEGSKGNPAADATASVVEGA